MVKDEIEKVLEVFAGISAGNAELAGRYINHERFIQHNPYAEDGVEGLKRFISQSPRDQLQLTVVRAIQDGPYVVNPGKRAAVRTKYLLRHLPIRGRPGC